MKLNNKGFAITSILYGLLILFVLMVGSYLIVLSVKKNNLDKITESIEDDYMNNIVSPKDCPASATTFTPSNNSKFSSPYSTCYYTFNIELQYNNSISCSALLNYNDEVSFTQSQDKFVLQVNGKKIEFIGDQQEQCNFANGRDDRFSIESITVGGQDEK